jgi:hypothetical protein
MGKLIGYSGGGLFSVKPTAWPLLQDWVTDWLGILCPASFKTST